MVAPLSWIDHTDERTMSALVIHQPSTLGRSRARVDVGAALLRVEPLGEQ
jgi:hypothetical protein